MKKGDIQSAESRAKMASAARLSWSDPSVRARRVRAALKRSGSNRTLEAVVIRQLFNGQAEHTELAITGYTAEGLPVVDLGPSWLLTRTA